MKLLSKKEVYEDLQRKNKECEDLIERLGNKDERIATKDEEQRRLTGEIENAYYTLKTIKELTKDKTIETLCIIKMQDIKNISGIYVD